MYLVHTDENLYICMCGTAALNRPKANIECEKRCFCNKGQLPGSLEHAASGFPPQLWYQSSIFRRASSYPNILETGNYNQVTTWRVRVELPVAAHASRLAQRRPPYPCMSGMAHDHAWALGGVWWGCLPPPQGQKVNVTGIPTPESKSKLITYSIGKKPQGFFPSPRMRTTPFWK